MDTKIIIKQLEEIEDEWQGILAGEKLAGNVVKQAEAKGVLLGLRMTIGIILRANYKTIPIE